MNSATYSIDWTHGGASFEAHLHAKGDILDNVSLIAYQGEDGLRNKAAAVLFAFHFIPAADLTLREHPDGHSLGWHPSKSRSRRLMQKLGLFFGGIGWVEPNDTNLFFAVRISPELFKRLRDNYGIAFERTDATGRSVDPFCA